MPETTASIVPRGHRTGRLADIPVAQIRPNPDNPRLTFRAGELEELQESIRRYGVQVPIAVFKSGDGYVLIDGERRWRCVSKLNVKTVPALVQDEPDPLQNLLLMFNIHALREQWDLLTIALKLSKIMALLGRELNRKPTEAEIAIHTGLSRGIVRKCRLLTKLPEKYKRILLEELRKPKSKQLVGEEFFVEMEKALNAISRNFPDLIKDVNEARDVLLKKYKAKVIESNIEFRKIGKIARSKHVGADQSAARTALLRLLRDPHYSVAQAWTDSVFEAYAERDIASRIDSLLHKLGEIKPEEVDDEIREKLEELIRRATRILESAE